MQNLANQLPNALIDAKKITKSFISTANTLIRIDILIEQLTNESKIRLKHGRHACWMKGCNLSDDKNIRKT